MNYKKFSDLQVIMDLLEEVNEALGKPVLSLEEGRNYPAILGAIGLGVGAAIGYTAVYMLGERGFKKKGITTAIQSAGDLVGGGNAKGVALLKAPAFALGGLGAGIGKFINAKKLRATKEDLYICLLEKQIEIYSVLNTERLDEERMDYLFFLNSCINSTLQDLKSDLI